MLGLGMLGTICWVLMGCGVVLMKMVMMNIRWS